MWKRVPKYQYVPVRAPPTLTKEKDGSKYFPPLVENVGKKQPGVPQTARTKSAKLVIGAIEKKRLESMSQKVKSNPLCHVSIVVERLPVVQPPLKTWQIDFTAVQGRAWDEIDQALPPSILKQSFDENPPWAVNAFKEMFGHRAESLLPLVSPPKIDDAKVAAQAAAAQSSTATDVGGKKGKKKKEKDVKDVGKTEVAKSGPADVAKAADASNAPPSWQKAMSDLGIEFAEAAVDDEAAEAMKLHVELKTKKDDKELDFVAEPRITEADRKNDTKSLERKLWNKLYLFVKRKGKWGFPQVTLKEKEGLLNAAKRAAFSIFPSASRELDLFFVSACPIGYRPADNAKDFMLKAQLLHGGNLDRRLCAEPIEDFAWLTPKEVAEMLVGKDEKNDEYIYIIRMLADDWWEDPTDSPEMSPVEDDLTMKPLRQLKDTQIRSRIRQEEEKCETLRTKALGLETTSKADQPTAGPQ